MGKMVHLRVSDVAYRQAGAMAKGFGFGNVQEYIREAVRRMNEEYETTLAIRQLKKLQGSAPPAKRMTREERRKHAEEFIKTDHSDIFRKYGFE